MPIGVVALKPELITPPSASSAIPVCAVAGEASIKRALPLCPRPLILFAMLLQPDNVSPPARSNIAVDLHIFKIGSPLRFRFGVQCTSYALFLQLKCSQKRSKQNRFRSHKTAILTFHSCRMVRRSPSCSLRAGSDCRIRKKRDPAFWFRRGLADLATFAETRSHGKTAERLTLEL